MKPTEAFLDFLVKLTVIIPPFAEIDRTSPLYLYMGRHHTEL